MAVEQCIRNISGFPEPSVVDETALNRAVDQVARASATLLYSLMADTPPKNRKVEMAKRYALAVCRVGNS